MNSRPLIAAGILMGIGLGGFFDGILFHQILHLHNMLSNWIPQNDPHQFLLWDIIFLASGPLLMLIGWHFIGSAGTTAVKNALSRSKELDTRCRPPSLVGRSSSGLNISILFSRKMPKC
jgi:uncharacterized membrane protein